MAKKTEVRAPTGHINPFGLRMQPELRARLEEAAAEAGRSLNAEIIGRLEESFERTAAADSYSYDQLVSMLTREITSQLPTSIIEALEAKYSQASIEALELAKLHQRQLDAVESEIKRRDSKPKSRATSKAEE